jgi:MFS family permease
VFVAARFFVGFGNIIASNAAPLLLTEICHPQHRGRVTTVYNQLWDIGSIVATWITFGTFNIKNNWSWRIPSIFQALPTLLLFIFIWVVPESPRWLLSKERDEEALAVLAKYHANGDEMDRDVQFEFHEIRETLRLEFEAKKVSGYLDFFQTKGNRYRLFLVLALGLFSQWSGNGLTSYYFALVMDSIGVTDADTQFKINGCKTILSVSRGKPVL